MSFFKKAKDKFDQAREHHGGPPQIPFASKPPSSSSKPDVMTLRDRWIVRDHQSGQLQVEGTGEVVRFASLCAPELFDNEGCEKEDTMRTIRGFGRWPVTRTYTLKVKSKRIGKGHINGWNPSAGDFDYAEDMFVSIDHVVATARAEGVRLIIPIINQDYGSEETNWVGNFTDLIRMRRGLHSWEEARKVDWWTDPECFDSMIKIVNKLLLRTNTFTGIRLCDDPTILAWETGNEMNCGGLRPAPGHWTVRVAEHIKKLSPKALVMDGSFSRNDDVSLSYPPEVLQSEAVDILNYHYYGFGEKRRVKADVEVATRHRKAFVAGEYGFFKNASDFAKFLSHLDSCGVAGSLAWSLRPHAANGGFKTHGEGNNIFSYHAPGWPADAPEWDHRERQVIANIRQAAFVITRDRVPRHPVPCAPHLLFHQRGPGSPAALFWRGGSWAATYEIWVNGQGGGDEGWDCHQTGLTDNVQPGKLCLECNDVLGRCGARKLHVMVRGISADGDPGPFSNIVEIG